MRLDKFTTKFQEALGDAQSLALGNDNAYIEPVHVLLAMLQAGRWPQSAAAARGRQRAWPASAAEAAIKRLPQVQGHDQVQGGPELGRVLQATEKEAIKRGDQFIASELFLLALTDSKGDAAQIAKDNGLTRKSLEAAINAVRGGQKVDSAEAEGQRERAEKVLPGPDRARPRRQARPGDWPRRRNPPRHPGAAAPQQEQPRADRRARRGQDGHCGRPGPAHRGGRSARIAQGQARAQLDMAACWPVPSTGASLKSA
jgi:ATP-dependent Clp protease ATP-binding subunit ClpA